MTEDGEIKTEIDELRDIIKQQKIGESIDKSGEYENPQKPLELASQILNPSPHIEELFPDITRDYSTSNLPSWMIQQLVDKYKSSNFEKAFGLEGNSDIGESLVILKANQSRDGFAVKELNTSRVEVGGSQSIPKKRGWGIRR